MTKSELLRSQYKGLLWLIDYGIPAEILYAARHRGFLAEDSTLLPPSESEFNAEDVEVVGRFYNKVKTLLENSPTKELVRCGQVSAWLNSCSPDTRTRFRQEFNPN